MRSHSADGDTYSFAIDAAAARLAEELCRHSFCVPWSELDQGERWALRSAVEGLLMNWPLIERAIAS
jgi:hypothetical protein